MDPIRIDSSSIIFIPGMIKHWQQEIENRKSEIIKYKNRGTLERMIDWIDEGDEFDDASGDELYDMSPSEAAKEMMERLEEDPLDNRSRLDLVQLISRSRKDLTIEMTRDLFLQATVACSFGEFSNQDLQIVLQTQEAYLKKLLRQCHIDQEKVDKILQVPLSDPSISGQRRQIGRYAAKIKRNKALIRFYVVCQDYELAIKKSGDRQGDKRAVLIATEYAEMLYDIGRFVKTTGIRKLPAHDIVNSLLKADETLL